MGETFFACRSSKAFPLVHDLAILVLGVFDVKFLAAAIAGVDQIPFLKIF